MAQVSEQLVDDHAALDKVLKQLQAALRSRDHEIAHAKLDLFWARLAVHIRAEHLHLFPAVINRVGNEAQTLVAQLRQDHEFFMVELARAVEIMRERTDSLNDVNDIVREVEQRLVKHNEAEENQIYRWATTFLDADEQAKLAQQITAELQNRPSRFTLSTWLNE